YNPTNRAINLRDYQLHYLYILNDLTITSSAEWPMEPHDAVVEPGKTVVVWVKNGPNDDLTAEDFAKNYGVNAEDLTLVEVKSAGMANGSPRGMELRTRTGEKVHRVNYNVTAEKDPAKDQGLHYGYNAEDPGNSGIFEKSPATPGSVKPEQVPGSAIEVPEDTEAPVIKDQSPKSLAPNTDAELKFSITDNIQVRRAELSLSNNANKEPQVHNLTTNGDGTYTFTIPQADLVGKRYFEYTVTATDGTNETTTEKVRVPLDGVNTDPLRLNVEDGQFVRGTVPISVASDNPGEKLGLCVNDTDLTETHASLEKEPVFAFETSQTDTFFRNGVLVDGEILNIFDEGTYSEWATISTDIPLNHVTAGKPLQVDIAAGTKAAPGPDPNENNDDFVVRNVRLVLPDGRTLRAPGWDDPAKIIQMGDSSGKVEVLEALFTIPEDAYNAQAAQWDSTTVEDGEHTVCGTDANGERVERTVKVDNTAPAITTSVKDGEEKRGAFTIDFEATDAGSGLDSIEATLDGEKIETGTELSSVTMPAGTHTLEITAKDKIGNVSKRTLTFTTPVEQPNGAISNRAGAVLSICTPGSLSARVSDPSGDPLTVSFREGHTVSLENETLTAVSGTVNNANQTEREGDTLKAGGTTTSDSELPYHAFTTDVPEGASDDSLVRVAWEGTTDPGARVRLLVWNTAANAYQEVDVALTDKETGEATLEAMVPLGEHAVDGEIRAVVQHSEGWAGPNLSGRDSAVEPYHPEDTPRDQYDFTFAWETDTQYYNESFYDHQIAIHNYLLERREALNLQYLFHTGDIVDKAEQQFQWDNANKAYKMLDEAGLPYGVLAGNHDVGHMSNDFTEYSKNFGEDRYAHNPWYGGSYQNNRGHYDLITAGGHDFIMLYMGWAPGDAEIEWMNEVLEAYPERTAIINLHEYMLTTGGLGPIPQRIYDEVITPNANVRAVMSGHYHDAYTRVDRFDDDGDGNPERTVTQMLFDYQALPEGGQGFLRLMHFDNKGQHVKVRTFSPSLKQYNADDATLEPEHQEFTISYDALGLEQTTKSLTTAKARVDVLTAKELGSVEDVESGTEAKVSVENLAEGEHTIYVLTTDPYGAKHYSALQRVTIEGGDCNVEEPENPGTDVDPNKPEDPNKPTKPSEPGVPGQPGQPGQPGVPGQPGQPGANNGTGSHTIGHYRPNQPAPGLAATGANVTALGLAAAALTMGGAAMAWMLRRRTR
ncbi:metallophosphoesterase, partial [Pseudoglutamicibacter cumminsii]|uniref:metallophosphoesterase n=1 Tax=Pseudoglutamicibacter cumminsii TaxID=156979 RepID=UPI0026F0D7C8